MYGLEIINLIVLLFLFYILLILLYQLYENQTEPSRFILPEFEESSERSIDIQMKKDAEVIISTPDDFHGFVQLGVLASEPFDVDWGNGIQSSYQGSTISQLFKPLAYMPGKYQIRVKGSDTNIEKVYYYSTFKTPASVEYKNFSKPPMFLRESLGASL